MNQHGTSIGWIILGFFLGGGISAFATTLFRIDSIKISFGVSVAGAILGVVIGYLMAWLAKQQSLRLQKNAMACHRRSLPPKPPSQVVGKKCTNCNTAIIFTNEGSFCGKCFDPFCRICKPMTSICQNCIDHSVVVVE